MWGHARRCLCVPAVALRRLCNDDANRVWEMLCDWKGHLTASLPISCEGRGCAIMGELSLPTVDPPTTERTSRSCDLHVKKTIKRLRTERHAANKLTGPFKY